ncbi:hypothetical protein [Haloferula rosea]|uniref:Uncharacterized protein n=1 Tax=Haloferula rosea TaxID=490093 RepID=A0A934RFC2_9BACT|nr:hypothetical protein [Haloferula rosea]MBK1827511.1 hypothetical protein [Haloferula rosea]
MLGSSQQPYRRYVRSVVGFFAFAVTLFAAVNTWINPLWVTPAPWTDEGFAEWRPIYRQQRTAKAGLVRSESWDAAFFGSSRIDIAMDPALPEWGDEKAVNLAVSAGTLPETSGILHYTIQNDPLQLAVVGIDLGDMLHGGSGMRNTGYMESPFNEKGDAFERELRYVVGISSFEASFRAITNRINKRPPEYTIQGHRLRHQENYDVAQVIDRDSIPHAMRVIRGRRTGISPNPWKMECLQRILDDTKAANCKLVVVLPPNHATYLGVYYYLDDVDPTHLMDRELILKMLKDSNEAHPDAPAATVWDFNDFHALNCEKFTPPGERMKWWLDGTHARKALGDVMLARIMDWPIEGPGKDYGVELTLDGLQSRSEQLFAGYERFKTESPDLWNWMVESISHYQE